MKNPLGLVKSAYGGKTLTKLGFEGESDFHAMGVGYQNHAVYVVNHAPNSRLPAGVHYSLDDGKTWKQSALQGLSDEPIAIAVHPTKAGMVAIAAQSGLFLSTNNGDTFEQINREPASAAGFSPSGDALFFGFQRLFAYDLANKQVRTLQTPSAGAKDAIGYIAANPVRPQEMVFATFGRDVHLSTDNGQTWKQIAL